MSQSVSNIASMSSSISSQTSVQIVDMDTERPLFKVGDGIYEGHWHDMVGTEVYTDMKGRPLAKTRKRLQLIPATMRDRSDPSGNDASINYWQKQKSETLMDKIHKITQQRLAEQEMEEDEDDDQEQEHEQDHEMGNTDTPIKQEPTT